MRSTVLGEEPHRLDTRVHQVPGVDAQLQAVVGRVVENPFDLVLELDVAAGVRVQHRRETVLVGNTR